MGLFMNNLRFINRICRFVASLVILVSVMSFVACDSINYDEVETVIESIEEVSGEDTETETVAEEHEEQEKEAEDVVELEDLEEEELHTIPFYPYRAFEYCANPVCTVNKESKILSFTFTFAGGVPESDDDKVYLFEIATYEDEASFEDKEPIAQIEKSKDMSIAIPYEKRHLFARFVPAILVNGDYVALARGQYLTNPESLACNAEPYPVYESKKGLLIDGAAVGSDLMSNLNVKRVVYNVPLSLILGETDSEYFDTIEYEYNGRTYHFNGHQVMIYDSLFKYLTEEGCHITAIVLNDWINDFPEMVHPKSRNRTAKSLYYSFNTEEEDGVRMMEAVALFLAERYSNGANGVVCDWVLANEINQQTQWNYMATDDLEYYTQSFEKSFRTFYNAIRSCYSNAHVYFSIDHDWNNNGGNNRRFFNGRDILYTFNECAKAGGNYDWGLAIHPYPNPLPKVRFWQGNFDKTEDARVLTPMNFSTLTDVMTKEEFLDTKGNVRNIAVTELGFTSKPGEKLQAAAFAYCYLIIENNPYINTFLLNRQTDDNEALKSGLALGIYNNDYSPKYLANVFTYIDTEMRNEYLGEMLEIIGASSLDEALSWAQ